MAAQRLVVWFRNDLRLTDNPTIAEAAKRLASDRSLELIPVYCFDPRHFKTSKTSHGYKKTGVHRARFMIEAVTDLRSRLRAIGSDLVVHHTTPESIMPSLLKTGAGAGAKTTIMAQEEVCWEELGVDKAVRASVSNKGGKLELHWGYSLYHRDDLPDKFREDLSGMPDVMTPFKDACERQSKIRPPMPAPSKLPALPADIKCGNIPTLEELGYTPQEAGCPADPRGVMQFQGGETAGLARVQDYIFDKDCLKDYFDTRNGMIGADFSTKFSPWLAIGCISPRYVAAKCKEYEEKRGIKNKSTYWVVWELTVRDFFRFLCVKYGNKVFFQGGIADSNWRWLSDKEGFRRWVDGTTGQPLVDANMRELKETGFMSNRGRQNVASYLTQNLNIDWRWGAAYFEEALIDHDVSANWGNWNAAAGVTTGRVNK